MIYKNCAFEKTWNKFQAWRNSASLFGIVLVDNYKNMYLLSQIFINHSNLIRPNIVNAFNCSIKRRIYDILQKKKT